MDIPSRPRHDLAAATASLLVGGAGYHPLAGPRDSTGRAMRGSRLPEPTTQQIERRDEEAILLGRIVARDERAFEELHRRYAGPLYSLAVQVTGSDRHAQDIVQEVFVSVWKEAARFDPARGAVGSWLFSMARHKSIDHVRREVLARKRSADVDLELEQAPDDVHDEAWVNLRRDRVRAAMRGLTEAQRTAIELAFLSGLTHVEVAERLGIPLGTAKTRIRSGLLRLREILGDSVGETDEVRAVAAPRDRRATLLS